MSAAMFQKTKSVPEGWIETLALFEVHEQGAGKATRTIQNRQQVLRALAEATGKGPTEITLTDLLKRQGRGVSKSSLQSEGSTYRVFYRWMVAEGTVAASPAARLPLVRGKSRKPRPISPQQLEDMLSVDPETGRSPYRKTRTMILLAAYQGWRVAEIARTRGEMFDLVHNRVRYVSKGGYDQDQEIHPLVRAEIDHYPRRGFWFPGGTGADGTIREGQPLHSRSVSARIGGAMRRAGIADERLTAHSLRHFFGTQLVQAGVDIRVVSDLMGHRLLSSTQLYTQVSEEQQAQGLSRMPQVQLPPNHYKRRHRPTEKLTRAETVLDDLQTSGRRSQNATSQGLPLAPAKAIERSAE